MPGQREMFSVGISKCEQNELKVVTADCSKCAEHRGHSKRAVIKWWCGTWHCDRARRGTL